MGPIPQGFTSTISYSQQETRYERLTKQPLDQPPVSKNEAPEETQEAPKTDRAQNFNVENLVKQIWGFASGRIAQAKADGASEEQLESLWQAAEKGVKQGFGEAKDMLEELGEMDDQLGLKIDSAFGQIMDRLEGRDLSAPTPQPKPVEQSDQAAPAKRVGRAIQIQQYERQTFALDLTTKEGDQILIRSVTEQSATAEDLKFGRLSSTQWSSSESSGYQLVIKGDLSDQERADLDALLADVNELASEFYDGDYETAFNMATDLNIDGTSLQSLDLSMKEVEQKSVGVYAEMAGQPASLPKGLAPLKEYAEKLMAAQEQWLERLDSPKDFLNVLGNHPMNRGSLEETARFLMW